MESVCYQVSKTCFRIFLALLGVELWHFEILDIFEKKNLGKNGVQKKYHNSKSAEKRGLKFKYVKIDTCSVLDVKFHSWTTLDF